MRALGPCVRVRTWLVAVCLLSQSVPAFGEEEAQLLELAKAGYRSTQGTIHSLSCTVAFESGFPEPQTRKKGKYWRSFNRVHIQDEFQDFFFGAEGEAHWVSRDRNPKSGQVAAGRSLVVEVAQTLDAWRYMLLEIDLYLQYAKQTPRAKRQRIEGRDCIALTLPFPFSAEESSESTVTFWLDVGRNYLPWKREMTSKDYRDEYEITEYAESKPGIFFPTKCSGRSYKGRQQTGAASFVLSELRINEPIANDVFQLPALPRGTRFRDMIKKQTYLADENWQQLSSSRAEPWERVALPAEAAGPGGQLGAQSTAPARSWTLWILPASVAVLLVAGVVWLYRRFRAGSTRAA